MSVLYQAEWKSQEASEDLTRCENQDLTLQIPSGQAFLSEFNQIEILSLDCLPVIRLIEIRHSRVFSSSSLLKSHSRFE